MAVVRIICRYEHLHDTEACVFGQWAAHKQLAYDDACRWLEDRWCVTLIPSGRCIHLIIGTVTPEVAVAVARKLGAVIPHIENWREVSRETKDLIKSTATAASQALTAGAA